MALTLLFKILFEIVLMWALSMNILYDWIRLDMIGLVYWILRFILLGVFHAKVAN